MTKSVTKKEENIDEPEEEVPNRIDIGDFVLPDGSRYSGEYISSGDIKKRNGKGTCLMGPEKYIGSWENDKMSGYGEYFFSNGSVYKGDFLNNMFDGNGVYEFPDGSKYDGEWHKNKMHGKGLYVDSIGAKFEGNFFNGMYDSGTNYLTLRDT